MPIDDEDIQWLLSVAEAEGLAEIEVHVGDDEVLIRRTEAGPALHNRNTGDSAAAVAESRTPQQPLPENVKPVKAPMSGVFYRAPSPESEAYAQVGQQVEEGDTVGLIEVMKLFNDVHSPVAGTVYRIQVQNEEHVEAGQTLMLIETE